MSPQVGSVSECNARWFCEARKIIFLTKNRWAIGEFDQGWIEAFEIGYLGFERKCIPDKMNNRECILVLRRLNTDAIIKSAR
jgi:hypothetical protein